MDETITSVVKDGLCTGCGTCVGICPKDAIEMTISRSKGIYLPHLDEERCNQCGICSKTCPGYEVDFNQLNREIFGKQPEDMLLGNYLNCYVGHATGYDIRYHSTSGGLVTALLIFALEQGIITGALVTKMADSSPLEPQPFIVRTKKEIISACKSKYCPVPANIALKEILKEEGKFAVVGLPCHIHGMRKAELVNDKLKERIALHLGLFCSHPTSFWGTRFLLHKYGVDQEDIARLDYRGEGWPGYMAIHLKDGTKKLTAYPTYGTFFWGLGFFTPMRCTLCFDQGCELADISFGDAWRPEKAEQLEDEIGSSLIVSRSTVGENLLKQAMSKREIILSSLESDKVKNKVEKKKQYRARSRVARLVGKKLPNHKMELPKSKFTDYPAALKLYLNILLSRRYLWWLITILSYADRAVGKLLLILRDLKEYLWATQKEPRIE